MDSRVDDFIHKSTSWQSEFKKLRAICLDRKLNEDLKWGKPCYTFEDNNVVILQGFKSTCAILFTKGALLKDPRNILEKPGENTRGARRIPFTDVQQIIELEPVLKSYIDEAIGLEKAGLKVDLKSHEPLEYPSELQHRLDSDPEFKSAFEALTPGRRRAYNLYFSDAKQASTRESRIEKCVPKILAGKGPQDR